MTITRGEAPPIFPDYCWISLDLSNGSNFMRRLLATALVALSVAGPASAQFITSDSSFGAKSLVTDTISGTTWLNLNVTQGVSFNDVLAALGSAQALSGFRLPTWMEIDGLFVDGGFSVGMPTGNANDPARIAANVSFASAFIGPDDPYGEHFRGYYSVQPLFPGVVAAWGAFTSVPKVITQAGFVTTDFIRYPDGSKVIQDPGWATWLISKNPPPVSPVPEPSTYAMMLVGLGTAGFIVRRRTSSTTHDWGR